MWSLGDEPEEFLIRVDRWALKVIWQGRSRRWSGKARPAERDDPVSFMGEGNQRISEGRKQAVLFGRLGEQ